jgi:hypothetical protein
MVHFSGPPLRPETKQIISLTVSLTVSLDLSQASTHHAAAMFNYLLALVPILLFFANPISQLFSPSTPRIHRLPRPQLNEDLLAIEEPSNYTCPPHSYTVHVVSRAPLVLYIEDFLTLEERRHLLEIRSATALFL